MFTYTAVARALHPAFAGSVPYAVIVVELEEGVRLLSNVIDCPADEIRIGMPVHVAFEQQTQGITLPVFRSRGAPA